MSHIDITGSNLGETLRGTSSHDDIFGRGGNDFLYGLGSHDRLWGQQDNDYLSGSSGSDYLDGGVGQDELRGGLGADTFRFTLQSESPFGSEDSVLDFNGDEGDKIDLGNIDADTRFFWGLGNQSFSESQLSYTIDTSNDVGVLRADVRGGSDVYIELVGAPPLDLLIDILE